jgi:hypothetical protein
METGATRPSGPKADTSLRCIFAFAYARFSNLRGGGTRATVRKIVEGSGLIALITRRSVLFASAALSVLSSRTAAFAQSLVADEARAIARDATIYGVPMLEDYRIQYSYFVNRNDPDFKAPWNTLNNVARVFTPDDKAIQTPNSDTPYSQLGADLRAEPLVLTVPAVEKGRYYSLQFVDMYTYNFAYVGSRATGNDAGSFLLAGPRWKGEKPEGIKAVIRSETDFDFVQFRTQLLAPSDLENLKKVQAGYKVQTLSEFVGRPAPPATSALNFPKPLTLDEQKSSLEFFPLLNFLLEFCPTHPTEEALMARFAKLNIGAHKVFDPNALLPEIRKAVTDGMTDAWRAFADFKAAEVDTGKRTAADGFGDRAMLKNDYMARMASAVLGIYGNTKDEAMYPAYFRDADGQMLNGANRYVLRFKQGQLPPANSFWSLTMYELPSSLLYANSINRYLINSPMLGSFKRDPDGGFTIYIQNEMPEKDLAANWLPAPAGPFWTTLRIYWPKPEALSGEWKQPPIAAGELNAGARCDMKIKFICAAVALALAATGGAQAEAPAGGTVPVTADNFPRAESDLYFGGVVKNGGFSKFDHTRTPAPLDKQTVVRLNRDTLYSAAVFDLDAGPVTITLPDAGKRFMSLQVIDEDQYTHGVYYGAGQHVLTRNDIGTRYVVTAVRTLVDPTDPKDLQEVHALQDSIKVEQQNPGRFEAPNWDPVSQKKVREALLALASTLPDTKRMFGTKDQVDPVRYLIGAASAWGGNPEKVSSLRKTMARPLIG